MLKNLSFLLAFFLFSSGTLSAKKCRHSKTSFDCLEYVYNYDGDTITFNIPDLHPLIGNEVKVRLNGIDTAEKRGSEPCEKKVALHTRDFVASILGNAESMKLKNIERGKYFRVLGELWVDGINLAELLLEKKLAIPYDGRSKTDYNWCDNKLF